MLSIRHRLLILQCSTVLITALFLGALSYSLFIPVISKLQRHQLEQLSREAAKDLQSYLNSLVQKVETIDLEEFHSKYGDLPMEELFVRHFAKLSGSFPLISYLDKEGNETVRLVNSRPSEYFFDLRQTPVVLAANAEPNKVQIGIVPTSPGFDQPALQLAITKIGYFGDEFLGTLLITVPLAELIQHLETLPMCEGGFLSLVDDQLLLLSSKEGPTFTPLKLPLPELPTRHQMTGEDLYIASAKVEPTSWRIVAALPYGTFVSELNYLKLLASLTGVLVTLIGGIATMRLVSHLTRNISLLIEHAEKVGSGDFNHYLELYQDPDFVKLGAAINTMTQDIAKHSNSRESLQQILQSIIDPLVVADQQGMIKQVNHATLELLGCEESRLLGKPLADLFPEPPTLLTEASFASALLRKRVSNLETSVQPEQGPKISVLFSSSPVPGRNIEMGVVGIIKNIDELTTARLAREHALREAEEAHRRIDALLKSVADGLIVTDLSGKVLLHNQPADQLLGQPGEQTFRNVLESLPDPTLSDSLPPFDITLPARAGAPHRIIQIHSSPVLDHRGSQTGMVSVLRDVTRERALEQIKSEFISTAAHELTSPLTSILGYSELLLDRELTDRFSPDQKRDFLEEILSRSESLSKIVDDLLNISRIESGQPIPLDIQPVAMEPLLKKTIDNFMLINNGHTFEVLLPQRDDQPALVDHDRIQQVFENLISNAVKYSPKASTIKIECSFEENFYKVQITDQGIGMSEQQLEKVFDKFYRCDSSNTAVGGLGLGMSIVQQIVDSHHGNIEITSELGKGTRVTLRLPLAG